MLDTIAMLSTINESAKTIIQEDMTMLNGDNLKCKKSTGIVAGFSDCCGDENWGNSLSGCSSEEEKLKSKKENSDCIYIGNYCSEEWDIGLSKICVAKKYSYCCYGNKFSKIIGNATRQQKLQTWGNAENTNCAGILIEQLQYLDFKKIDFSELYEDIKSSVNQEELEKQIQQSLGRLQNGI
jgi:conjugal transfer mating pair stabilization protein TraN